MSKTPVAGTAAELAALYPGARVVPVIEPLDAKDPTKPRAQKAVIVRPLNAIEAAQLVLRMTPLFEAFDPSKPTVQLIGEHMPTVIDLAAASTDREGAWLQTLDAGDLLDVLVQVIEANENFLRRVADLVAGPTGKRLKAIFSSAGPTLSSSSQSTALLKPASSPPAR